MADPQLIAKIVIDNKQALDAIQEVQKRGVDATEAIADNTQGIEIAFTAWQVAAQAVGVALQAVGKELQKAFEMAVKAAGEDNEAVNQIRELEQAYQDFLMTIGNAIIDNEQFTATLGKISDLFNKMIADESLAKLVDDLVTLTSTIADGLIWLEKHRDIIERITLAYNSGGMTEAFRSWGDSLKFFTGEVEENAEVVEKAIPVDIEYAAGKTAIAEATTEATAALEVMKAETQALADIEAAAAVAKANYDDIQKARTDELIERQKELSDWVESTNKRIADKYAQEEKALQRQIEGVDDLASAITKAATSAGDKLLEMYGNAIPANRTLVGGALDAADAIEEIGDKGEDALRRMAKEAGVFIDTVSSGAQKMGSSRVDISTPEKELEHLMTGSSGLTGINIVSDGSKERRIMELQKIIREQSSSGGGDGFITEEDAGRIGAGVARAMAALADRDGTLNLAQAGIR